MPRLLPLPVTAQLGIDTWLVCECGSPLVIFPRHWNTEKKVFCQQDWEKRTLCQLTKLPSIELAGRATRKRGIECNSSSSSPLSLSNLSNNICFQKCYWAAVAAAQKRISRRTRGARLSGCQKEVDRLIDEVFRTHWRREWEENTHAHWKWTSGRQPNPTLWLWFTQQRVNDQRPMITNELNWAELNNHCCQWWWWWSPNKPNTQFALVLLISFFSFSWITHSLSLH